MGIINSINSPHVLPSPFFQKVSVAGYFTLPTIRNYWCSRGGMINGKMTDLNVRQVDTSGNTVGALTDTGLSTSLSTTLTFSPVASQAASTRSKEIENFKSLTVVAFNSFPVDTDTTGGTANCNIDSVAVLPFFTMMSNTIPVTPGYAHALFASVFRTSNVEGMQLTSVQMTMTMPAEGTTSMSTGNDVKAQEVFVLPGAWEVAGSNTNGGSLSSVLPNDIIFASSRSSGSKDMVSTVTGTVGAANVFPTFSGTAFRGLLLDRMTNSCGTNEATKGQAFTSLHYVTSAGTFIMAPQNYTYRASHASTISVPYNQSVLLLRKIGV